MPPPNNPLSTSNPAPPQPNWRQSTTYRVAKYIGLRLVVLVLTAVAGVYITILAANLGGKIDDIKRNQIAEAIALGTPASSPEMQGLSGEERVALLNQRIEAAQEAAGLNEPFLLRTLYWLKPALTLDLGETNIRTIGPGPNRNPIATVIMERVPATLLLFGVTNLFTFIISIWLAVYSSRSYGGWFDKLIVWLAPVSVAPSWFYGIFLMAIFAGWLSWLPFGGMWPSPPPAGQWEYALAMSKHMVLPFAAVFFSAFFQTVYVWRTFFLIYAGEDYVEMAKAKGLPSRLISRRYVLRPSLPPILTSFALLMIGAWSGSIILEILFSWPGLGQLFFTAITRFDNGVIVGLTVFYAYFLAATIFVLDLAYAFVDPRLQVGGVGDEAKAKVAQRPWRERLAMWWSQPQHAPSARRWTRPTWAGLAIGVGDILRAFGRALQEIFRHPSAVAGLVVILFMVGLSVYTISTISREEMEVAWRGEGDLSEAPKNARPLWVNYVTLAKLPPTLTADSRSGDGEKITQKLGDLDEILITLPIEFEYSQFPQSLVLEFATTSPSKTPHVSLSWLTPDGRTINMGDLAPRNEERYYFNDNRLLRRLDGLPANQGLFADPATDNQKPLEGTHYLQISAISFEEGTDVEAKLVVYGVLHGWGGTDGQRRDLGMALLWGLPTALGFGVTAAVITTIGMMFFASLGAWYGGWIDGLIQRVSDVNLVVPLFPILAMITLFYNLSIWYLLAVAALFTIFGSGIKNYRAIFLQVKQSPYIEAAQAYGASDGRIITRYLVPRIMPVLVPQLVTLIPTYVFLEASLAFIGLSHRTLPTWGKIISDAHRSSALLNGHYYWILQPTVLLLLTSLAFALFGFALERIFNPRLQTGE
jgi:peptide/nickel transport system permease protein